ncbi:MAG TPA: DEAD/DEAH box helicase [Xanthomonadales bacterium]|nr:DEAD/DEAH box helicase [Xanthomonadales bacterium]
MLFTELGLSAELLRAIHEQGYEQPTPIQQQAIPEVLAGHDLLGGAQTGTGKTAAFTLPVLQRLQDSKAEAHTHRVRALILVPTRELAMQVHESVTAYGKHLPFRSAMIFGGVSINPQISQLRRGVDIVVATPGRLLDHMERRSIDLRQVDTLVLDEADRMLDMGFVHDIRRVVKALSSQRQTLLFSATFSREIRQLAHEFQKAPREVQVTSPNSTADRVSQVVHPVDRERKREMLSHLIGQGNWQQVLVFTRTKHGANRLSKQLEQDGLSSSAIHGNKSQAARQRALSDFKKGGIRVLVATDVAARGLDIELLPHVVNYDLPNVPEDYVHRIGRTARAGQEGAAVSLVCVDEHSMLRDIEQLLQQRIEQVVLSGYEPDPSIKAEPIKMGGRSASRPNSRPGSRASSRPGSRPGSGPGHKKPGGQSAGRGRGRSNGQAAKRGSSQPSQAARRDDRSDSSSNGNRAQPSRGQRTTSKSNSARQEGRSGRPLADRAWVR